MIVRAPGTEPRTAPEDTVTPRRGALIINADDWGRDRLTTDRTLECVLCGAVSSVSAMVFMQDSERSAQIAGERQTDAGLHLNFTTPFSAPATPSRLKDHQQRISAYLWRSRFAQVVFHPGLTRSFEYVVAAQSNEFIRLYGRAPDRLDGHHHMHLCANMLVGGLLPPGTTVRRNFSFRKGEGLWNRLYRGAIDRFLERRYRVTDYLFSLVPLEPSRIQTIVSLARDHIVELETHPVNPNEHQLLAGAELFRGAHGDLLIPPAFLSAAIGPQ